MTENENDELNLKETLAMLKIGRSSLYRLINQNRIQPSNRTPLLSRPRELKFRRGDIKRLLQDAEQEKEAHSRLIAS